jgi:ABC-type multidrug transport system ATPase subunit
VAVIARARQVATGSKLSGRKSFRLLWASSKPLSAAVLGWAALDAVDGPLVVGALGTAASQRISGQLQARLLTAVTAPATVAHLEDEETLNRLAAAEGSLTGFFPGDAPVTWVGSVAGRLSGLLGCAVIAAYFWWLGLLLLVMWLAVRRVILKSVLRQAIDMRGQTTEMRCAWYCTGVGSKARDAKEVRVFGLARFFGGRYAAHFTESIRAGHAGLRGLHKRAAGTSTALVGVNGAGKSTLVSLLARLRDPTSGRITVDGTDVRDLDPGRWQRTIALMPQDPVRYPLTAYDNVAFGSLEHAGDRAGVERAARLSGFAAVAAGLPLGWDTVLARELPGGAELSGRQWQRLALARALFATFHGARILVLDEPTAALDVRAEAPFYERFHEITAGLTTLVISHRFATVRRAQRIYVLDGGVITERGSHDELVAAGGTYAEMYRVQAKRFAT